jgi:hypothetical protein
MRSWPVKNRNNRSVRSVLSMLSAFTLSALLFPASAALAEPKAGDQLKNPEVRDARDQPATLPEWGKKVLLVMYTDPDEADQNDAFADAVKAADLPKDQFQSMGVANMQDAPAKPNWIIRRVVRKKIEKYNTTILTDPKHLLIDAWNLGKCDDLSVVLLIDKKGTLRYFHKGKLDDAERGKALTLLRSLIEEAKSS